MKKRLSSFAAVAVLGAGVLSGCSGGDGSDYCNRVRDNIDNKTLEQLDPSDPGDLQRFVEAAKQLQADAPEEVKDDYDVLVKAFEDPANASADVATSVDTIQRYDEDNCDVTYENS